jgi:hypothetical protein
LGPKLLTVLFLEKPSYPCPFEILAEALTTHGKGELISARPGNFINVIFR